MSDRRVAVDGLAGATHELIDWAREGWIAFSVGYHLTEMVVRRSSICRRTPEFGA